jgi:hypothetical protein
MNTCHTPISKIPSFAEVTLLAWLVSAAVIAASSQ